MIPSFSFFDDLIQKGRLAITFQGEFNDKAAVSDAFFSNKLLLQNGSGFVNADVFTVDLLVDSSSYYYTLLLKKI